MKGDLSVDFYQKYLSVKNKGVTLTGINGEVWKGFIAGFFKGDVLSGESYIYRWHIVFDSNDFLGYDAFGHAKGIFVRQITLANVKFDEDGTVINFE